jgi:hypothetical protein
MALKRNPVLAHYVNSNSGYSETGDSVSRARRDKATTNCVFILCVAVQGRNDLYNDSIFSDVLLIWEDEPKQVHLAQYQKELENNFMTVSI